MILKYSTILFYKFVIWITPTLLTLIDAYLLKL